MSRVWRKDLLAAAEASDRHEVEDRGSYILVSGPGGVVVLFWDDGSMYRSGSEQDCATRVRYVTEAAEILDLDVRKRN